MAVWWLFRTSNPPILDCQFRSQQPPDFASIGVPIRRLCHSFGAIFSGCFDGCSLPTFVHFAAMDCKDGLGGNTFILNCLCDGLRVIATCCRIAKNRLKIRRSLRSWGFDPPPGTKKNHEFRLKLASQTRGQFSWWLSMCASLRSKFVIRTSSFSTEVAPLDSISLAI